MKLTAILLTFFAVHVMASTDAQTITYSGNNVPLKQVLQAVKKQTGYLAVYNAAQVEATKPVTVNAKDEPLAKFLTEILKGQGLEFSIENKTIVISPKEKNTAPITQGLNPGLNTPVPVAPPLDVKGIVRDESGKPAAGVSVQVKGTNKGTTTNSAGEFSLIGVDDQATLVFSSVNLQPFEVKITPTNAGDLAITLKAKVSELADVTISTISTGYQTIPKERATGSFAVIDNKTLNQQVGTNILQRLNGVTSGLQFNIGKINPNPQNKTNITIRGLSTINGPLDPLVVLDGFIYEGDIQNINPNDVENITVLKDAAATSIWGARAGNGVIVITSKKGNFNQKLQVSASANTIFNSKPDLYYLPQMSSADYIDVEQMLFNQGYFNSQITGSPRTALTPAVEIFLKRKNRLISSSDSSSQINKLKNIDSRNEYLKHFYTNAVTQQYSINVRGGSNNSNYIFSIGYDKVLDGQYGRSQKINIKSENNFKLIKNLVLHTGVYYTNSNSNSGRGLSNNSLNVNGREVPYLKFDDDNGNPVSIATGLSDRYTDTAGGGKLLNWKYFPLTDYKYNRTTNNVGELYATAGLQYNLFSFLNIDIKYQFQKQQGENEQLSEIESFKARSLVNGFTEINRSTGLVKYYLPMGDIKTMTFSSIRSSTGRAQLNVNHEKNNHSIYAVLGGEIREATSTGNDYTIYGYKADPFSYINVDFINPYPRFISGAYDYISGAPTFSGVITNRFISFYGNGSYTFKNRYIISASARRDGSNIFGLSTNDKWKPLWSVGGSWKISKEGYYSMPLIPTLIARVTYGHSGNVDLKKSALPVGRYQSGGAPTNLPSTFITQINNADLRWEEVGILNFGLDFSFKKEVITGSIEYYLKNGKDLYGETPYDYTTWGVTRTITKNVANIQGQGVDVVLNIKNIDQKIKWTSSLLFNYNTAKTTKYNTTTAARISSLLGAGGYGSSIYPVVGKPMYSIAAYKWGGLNSSGIPQGYVNGQLSTDYAAIRDEGLAKGEDGNIAYVGPATPVVFGSLINSITWKNFSFSANISYKFGYFFRKSIFTGSSLIAGYGHKDYVKRWQQPGDEKITDVPAFIYPNNGDADYFYTQSTVNILRADHIKLQYINVAYTFSKINKSRIAFKELQVYFNASNLGILWRANKEGLDPDYPASLPPVKSYAFGLRANF